MKRGYFAFLRLCLSSRCGNPDILVGSCDVRLLLVVLCGVLFREFADMAKSVSRFLKDIAFASIKNTDINCLSLSAVSSSGACTLPISPEESLLSSRGPTLDVPRTGLCRPEDQGVMSRGHQ